MSDERVSISLNIESGGAMQICMAMYEDDAGKHIVIVGAGFEASDTGASHIAQVLRTASDGVFRELTDAAAGARRLVEAVRYVEHPDAEVKRPRFNPKPRGDS